MRNQTYVNPVWGEDFPDPFVLVQGRRFYAYATETGKRGHGFQVMESADLVHWKHRGLCFTPPWSKEHLWAPEVVVHGGIFYLLYSALSPRNQRHEIGIATSRNPLGPFHHKSVLVACPSQNRIGVIDATLFFENQTPYLLYCQEEPRRIVLQRLTRTLDRTAEPARELIRPDQPQERGVTEAPTLIKHGSDYILFFSSGGFESNKNDASYAVRWARARKITGPYTKATRPLLETIPGKIYGPGHQSVIQTPAGEWWMLYHGWDATGEPRYGSNPLGRTLRMERLMWNQNTPVVNGPTLTSGPVPHL